MAKELGRHGIAVNAVAPGAIETDFGGGAVRDNPELNQQFSELTALGRVGLPDDIGPMIARRSEEHTSELQSLMRISYAVFCLKKTNIHKHTNKDKSKNENIN